MRPGSLPQGQRTERAGSIAALGRNFAWLLGGRGAAAVFSLVYIAILTRTLGPSGFGQFALIVGTAQAVTAFVGFQTWQIVVRFGMPKLTKDERPALVRLLKFCLALDVAGAVVGVGLAALVIASLGPLFGWQAELKMTAFLFAIATLLSVRSTAAGILRLYDRFGLSAYADATLTAARMIGALLAWVLAPSVSSFVLAWGVAELASMIVYWTLARHASKGLSWRQAALSFGTTLRETPGLLRFTAITNVAQTTVLAGKQLPVLLTGIFVGPAAAGGFQIALQLGRALAKIGQLAVQTLLPEMMRSRTFDRDPDAFGKLVFRALKIGLIAGALVACTVLLLGKPVLVLVAGAPFVSAYPLLLLVGIAAAIDLGTVSLEPALYAGGQEMRAFRVRIVVTSAYIVSMIACGYYFGAIGIAAATLAAALIAAIGLAMALKHVLKASEPSR